MAAPGRVVNPASLHREQYFTRRAGQICQQAAFFLISSSRLLPAVNLRCGETPLSFTFGCGFFLLPSITIGSNAALRTILIKNWRKKYEETCNTNARPSCCAHAYFRVCHEQQPNKIQQALTQPKTSLLFPVRMEAGLAGHSSNCSESW